MLTPPGAILRAVFGEQSGQGLLGTPTHSSLQKCFSSQNEHLIFPVVFLLFYLL